jgi:predicted RNA-binding Zn-ribbon protein involved in translation (DUF1610 family)
VTEQEWLTSDDPVAMLAEVVGREVGGFYDPSTSKAGDRKLRLFACACWRGRVMRFSGSRPPLLVAEFGEGLADGVPLPGDRPRPTLDAAAEFFPLLPSASEAAAGMAVPSNGREAAGQAALLRDIVGNPFRPAYVVHNTGGESSFDVQTARRLGKRCVSIGMIGRCVLIDRDWLTPAALALAQAAYDERDGECLVCTTTCKPGRLWADSFGGIKDCHHCHGTGRLDDGTLDPHRLAVLADALEEAGCPPKINVSRKVVVGYTCPLCGDAGFWRSGQEFDHMKKCRKRGCGTVWIPEDEHVIDVPEPHPLLAHLRSGGPHVRGCWAVDLVLGKE